VIAANDPALTLKPFGEAIKGNEFAALKAVNRSTGLLPVRKKPSCHRAGTNWLLVVALDSADATSGMRSQLKASPFR
jgi:methyl-accepting chemotaxis protein